MKKSSIALLGCLVVSVILAWMSFSAVRSAQKEVSYDPVESRTSLMEERARTFEDEGRYEMAKAAYVMILANFPSSDAAERSLRWLASKSQAEGDLKRAIYYFSRLIREFPKIADINDIRGAIEDANIQRMRSALRTEDSIEYTVVPGDSLYVLARRFNTTVDLIKQMNNLKTDVIQVGQRLKINTARFSILVDKHLNELILKKDGKPFKTYTVATGKDNSTPVGVFEITEKMIQPVWTKPGVGMIMPDSDEYELGARWMAISKEGYGIHGTNDESSIGGQTTAGCVRMFNDDVIELYSIVPVGTEVRIIDTAEGSGDLALEDKEQDGQTQGEQDGDST